MIYSNSPKRHPVNRSSHESRNNRSINRNRHSIRELTVKQSYLLMLFYPLMFLYFEFLLKLFLGRNVFEGGYFVFFFSLSAGMFFYFICNIWKKYKLVRTLNIIVISLFAFVFLLEFFLNQFFTFFMGINAILNSGGDMMKSYLGTAVVIVLKGLYVVILYAIPLVLYCIFFKGVTSRRASSLLTKVLPVFFWIIFYVIALIGVYAFSGGIVTYQEYYTSEYNISESSYRFGLVTGTRLDIQYFIFGTPKGKDEGDDIIVFPSESEMSGTSSTTSSSYVDPSSSVVPSPKIEYGYNVMDIDFDTLISKAKNDTVKSMHEYFSAQRPTQQNEFTGKFKGKNLIVITAEAFSWWAVNEKYTPTLYRMMTKGIYFTNYYQPAWGYSTSDGEYSHLTGLVPKGGVQSIYESRKNNLYFTLGHQSQRLGYFTRAYHNNSYTYYKRNETHVNLGYEKFIAMGNGLPKIDKVWPRSDLQLMEVTVDDYIDKQPFSIYYMTVSGHAQYTWVGNYMSYKHKNDVADLNLSENAAAYVACNMELDLAMKYLIERLEEAGIADDTVIVLTGDHYPYGLESNTGYKYKNFDELNGSPVETNIGIHKNCLIIWSGCLEKEEPIQVDEPTYSLDILPTVSNLFGMEYDSRLLVGRDVFAKNTTPLVLFRNYSWITDKGYYNALTQEFTPADESITVDEDYIKTISAIVKNKVKYSKYILEQNYYNILFK